MDKNSDGNELLNSFYLLILHCTSPLRSESPISFKAAESKVEVLENIRSESVMGSASDEVKQSCSSPKVTEQLFEKIVILLFFQAINLS